MRRGLKQGRGVDTLRNFRRLIIAEAQDNDDYESFQKEALAVIPKHYKPYIGPHLPEIYLDIQEEMAISERKKEIREKVYKTIPE